MCTSQVGDGLVVLASFAGESVAEGGQLGVMLPTKLCEIGFDLDQALIGDQQASLRDRVLVRDLRRFESQSAQQL
jgi:hypothetical protein